jgi:phospholipid/cholesterol/gamma-HCH transport system permease protein
MADNAVERKPAPRAQAKPEKQPANGANHSPLSALLSFVGETTILAGQTLAAIVRGGLALRDLVGQMAAIGVDSIWIVLVVTTATGAVFAFYISSLSRSIGFTGFVGGTLGYAFLNELGPVLGGVAFAARSGAAIAAEIGTMVVTEQVDALRAMAVSPIRYLVAPRVLAAVIMLPLLIVCANIAGLTGGYVFSGVSGIPHAAYIESVHTYTHVSDLTNGMIKSVIFGFIVGIVACQQGLKTQGGATGVGRSTTSSVVLCVLLIFVSDFFLTQILAGGKFNR